MIDSKRNILNLLKSISEAYKIHIAIVKIVKKIVTIFRSFYKQNLYI